MGPFSWRAHSSAPGYLEASLTKKQARCPFASFGLASRVRAVCGGALQASLYAPFDPREPLPWRQVWDWEKASSLWAERERMGSYVAERAASMAARGLWVPRLEEERPWEYYGETESAALDDAAALCVIDPIETPREPVTAAPFPGPSWQDHMAVRRRGRGGARRMKEEERSPLNPLFGRLYEKWVWAEQNVRSNGRVPKGIRSVAEFEEWHGAMVAEQQGDAAHELTFNACLDTRTFNLEAPAPEPALEEARRRASSGAGSSGRAPVLSSGWAGDPWEAEPSSPRRLSISHSRKKIRGWEPGSPRRGVSPAGSPRGSPGRSPPGTPRPGGKAALPPPSGQLISNAVKQVQSREAAMKQREAQRHGGLPLLPFGRRAKPRGREEKEEEEEAEEWSLMDDSFSSKVAHRWGTGEEEEAEQSPAIIFRLPNMGQTFNLGSLNDWKDQLQKDKEAAELTPKTQPLPPSPSAAPNATPTKPTVPMVVPSQPSLVLPPSIDSDGPAPQQSPRRSRRRSRRRAKTV
jgi:hypothetical protein